MLRFQGIPTLTLEFDKILFCKRLRTKVDYVLDVLVVRMIFTFWPSFTNKLIMVLRLFHQKISHLDNTSSYL